MENSRTDDFTAGVDWAIDNILWWTFLAGTACGVLVGVVLMCLVLL